MVRKNKNQVMYEKTKQENVRLNHMTPESIANEYINYPILPYGKKVQVWGIGVINPHKDIGLVYRLFRERNPTEFSKGTDEKLHFMDHEEISPVKLRIKVHGEITECRVNPNLWYPLKDICMAIQIKQGRVHRKLLPIEIYIDTNNQWLCNLMNLCPEYFY